MYIKTKENSYLLKLKIILSQNASKQQEERQLLAIN